MIENLFPPIPSEIILTFSGFIAKKANLSLFLIVLFSTLGSVIGAIILYYLGYFLNDKIINILKLDKDKMNKTISEFNENGKKSVFIGRLAPIVRSLISIPAGIAKMNIVEFIVLTTIGGFIWNSILILLGNMIGDNYLIVSKYISSYYKPIVILLMVIFIIKRIYKKHKIVAITR
ncbi:MAG: DedA family protein [Erysipelotrichales bacterium]|nr:DedA family protein [Erysipelotrichales bacterium]